MKPTKHIYDTLLAEHLARHRQMTLVSGPRQVGKTTTCEGHAQSYANWDNIGDRERILAGPARLVDQLGLKWTWPLAFNELRRRHRSRSQATGDVVGCTV